MGGTVLNVIAIVVGGLLGLLLGGRLPEKLRHVIISGCGVFLLALGVQWFLKSHNMLVTFGSLLIGILLGEWIKVENGLAAFGKWLEARLIRNTDEGSQARFLRGFLTASLLFCIGPMAILGPVEAGLNGDLHLLVVKSILDAIGSMAFASSLGVGVLFSALPIFLYQGAVTLLAAQAQTVFTPLMMDELSATGGLLMIALAISSILELRPIRVGNFLPALVVSPVLVALLVWFKVM